MDSNLLKKQWPEYHKLATKNADRPYCDKLKKTMNELDINKGCFLNQKEGFRSDDYQAEIDEKAISLSEGTFDRIYNGEKGTKRETVAFIAKVLSDIAEKEIKPDEICSTYSWTYEDYLFEGLPEQRRGEYKKCIKRIRDCFDEMSKSQACGFVLFFDECCYMEKEIQELIAEYNKLNYDGQMELVLYAIESKTTIASQIGMFGDVAISGYLFLSDYDKVYGRLITFLSESKENLWKRLEEKITEKVKRNVLGLEYIKKISDIEYLRNFVNAIYDIEGDRCDLKESYCQGVWLLAASYRFRQGKQKKLLFNKLECIKTRMAADH